MTLGPIALVLGHISRAGRVDQPPFGVPVRLLVPGPLRRVVVSMKSSKLVNCLRSPYCLRNSLKRGMPLLPVTYEVKGRHIDLIVSWSAGEGIGEVL